MTGRGVSMLAVLVAIAIAAVVARPAAVGARGGPLARSAEPPIAFNRTIRPILADNCFHCHGVDPATRAAGLRLDRRDDALMAGAIVPGAPAASPLVARISSVDPEVRMPPPSSHRELSDDDRRVLARWIAEGAVYEEHWAFVAPRAAVVARDAHAAAGPTEHVAAGAIAHPIDAIVRRRLAREGLALAPEADRRTLLRRLTLDLTGLPPTRDEIRAYLDDRAPGAYERVVDRLLASPQYGERMALPWLDAARYADSNGFQQDGDTFQWLWRDWLVRQLNADLPYDRLSIEMLAGDLLPDATDETRLASAFNRNHLLNGEGGAIPEETRWTAMFDRVDATATTWLGLTMSCAQCHDHKYDPITQRDYYAFLDAFNRVPERGNVDGAPSRIRVAAPVLEDPGGAMRARRDALEQALAAAGDGDEASTREARDAARAALERFLLDEWPRVMVMSDAEPRETHVLARGVYTSPLEKVAFATPAFLPPMDPSLPRDRLGLARWLFAPENPLVARVAANRAWQAFFGDGLVRTPEDFGVQSAVPEQLELLDELAARLRDGGWRMKELHRLIVTSAVYRQSSRATPELLARDPENRLLARAPRHRLPSMILRDVALASAGLLDPRLGGAPVYPYQPEGIWEPLAITKERDFTYPASHGADLWRRSLYTFWRRTIAPANAFDASPRQTCRVRVPRTESPLHALVLLNDPTWNEAARVLAARVARETRDARDAAAAAFEIVTGREPDDVERAILSETLETQRARFARDPAQAEAALAIGEAPRGASADADGTRVDPATEAALAATCLLILNLEEATTRE